MTAIASAVPQAATTSPPASLSHLAAGGTHGFSAALDALTACEGKARSTEDDGKHATDDPSDSASSDLRAALIGGALASLAVAPAAAPAVAVRPADANAGGTAAEDSAGNTGSPARIVASTEAQALAPQTAGGATPRATGAVGAKVTAERSYLAPATFAPLTGVATQTSGDAVSTFDAAAAASRAESAPGDARTVVDGRSATTLAERTSAVSPAGSRDAPSGAGSRADPSGGAVFPDAHASQPAPAVLSEPLPAATAPGAPRRATPPSSRESGSTAAATSGSAGSVASAIASTSGPAKAHVDSALDRGVADGKGPSAAPTVQPDASSFGAAPALAAFSLSDSATEPAEAASQTRAPIASTTPLADKVREIDLDLAPSGLKDVTMTVRLAGDKLGVVVRAASGETAAAIEGARDAIAERLAAIGQPLTSLIIQETGASDAKGATGQSAGEGEGGAPPERGGGASDPRGSRRGSARF